MTTTGRQASSPAELRRTNAAQVLGVLRARGPLTITELTEEVGLARPTVTHALEFLVHVELVENPVGKSSVSARASGRIGRPAQRYRFRADHSFVAGAEIGPNRVVIVLADLAGNVLARVQDDALGPDDPRDSADVLAGLIRLLLAENHVPRERLRHLVIGLPGMVMPGETIVRQGHDLKPRDYTKFTSRLSTGLGCDVHLENDVNLAVLGESWKGNAQGRQTVAYVHWGTRIGAGLLVNGRLHRGGSSAAGEIGHISNGNRRRRRTEAGHSHGLFEQAVGAPAITALGQAAARRNDGGSLLELAGGNADAVNATTVLAAAKDGDPVALAITEEIIERFAAGLAPLFLVLDPDLVVLGGAVATAGEWLLGRLQESLSDFTLVPVHLALSALHNDAAAIGGLWVALDLLEPTLVPRSTT